MPEMMGGYTETIEATAISERQKETVVDFSMYEFNIRLGKERRELSENRDEEKETLEDLLKDNPKEQNFIIYNGEYIPESQFEGTDSPVFLELKTRKQFEERISVLKEALREDRIDSEIKRLDNLIMGVHKDSPNMRLVLMELRSQLTGYGKIENCDFYGEDLQDVLFFLERSETETLGLGDYTRGTKDLFNFLRKHLVFDVKVITAAIKDVTSSKLYQYGKENIAPFEAVLEDNIIGNNYIPDSAEPYVIQVLSSPAAAGAGAIDGVLDYVGGVAEINLAPEEFIYSFGELASVVKEHFGEIFTEIGKSIDGLPEIRYIEGYLVGLILGAIYVPTPLVWGTLIAKIVKSFGTFLRGYNVSENLILKVESTFTKATSSLKGAVEKIPEVGVVAKQGAKAGKEGKKVVDRAYEAIKHFNRGSKDDLLASRKIFETATNTAILANIFGDKIQGQLDEKTNTDIAMQIYEEEILKGNGQLFQNIEYSAHITSGELQYNIIRTKEKFQEIREVMDKEVMPSIRKLEFAYTHNIFEYSKLKKELQSSKEYNELTREIFKYIKLK